MFIGLGRKQNVWLQFGHRSRSLEKLEGNNRKKKLYVELADELEKAEFQITIKSNKLSIGSPYTSLNVPGSLENTKVFRPTTELELEGAACRCKSAIRECKPPPA